MFTKILTWLFNIYFYLFCGCCQNCCYEDACSKLDEVECGFMEDNGYPNYYKINKECSYYKYRLNNFLKRFEHKRSR